MKEDKSDFDNEQELKEKRDKLIKGIKGFFSFDGADKTHGKNSEDHISENHSSADLSSIHLEQELAEKRKKFIETIKNHRNLLLWSVLVIIIIFTATMRMQNFPLLKEVTTGEYVSTDLDSHIYLKYAREILATGKLAPVDYDRFVPIGAPTANYAFPAYFIYYLYKFMHFFDPSVTIFYADVFYPVLAFALAMIFFFLLLRKIFDDKTALVATGLLAIMPAFIQRTTGGSSDHDALGIMFLFLALYLFIAAWDKKFTTPKSSLFAILAGTLAGVATGLTGLSWGAWKFLYLIVGIFVFLQFLLKKIERDNIYIYTLWLFISIIVMTAWVPLFPLKSLFTSMTTIPSIVMLFVLVVDTLIVSPIFNASQHTSQYSSQPTSQHSFTKLHSFFSKLQPYLPRRLPQPIVSIIFVLVIGIILSSLLLGPAQLGKQIMDTKELLLHPMGKDRWELTVAEQHQPYFDGWVAQFGPVFFGLQSLPSLFLLFIIGALLCSYQLWKKTKGKFWLICGYFIMLGGVIFSRYKPDSWLNGASTGSVVVYLGSIIFVFCAGLYSYVWLYNHDKKEFNQLTEWDSPLLFMLIWVFLMLIAMRGAIRLTIVFAPVVAALAGYVLVQAWAYFLKIKVQWQKWVGIILLLFIVFSPLATPFKGIVPESYALSDQQAKYSGAPYNQQWQMTGKWVRDNLPEDAVFGHWWDYGYWVQNGFERASVLDGANKVKYWNYLMGRHVLSGQTQEEALEFLKVHKTTHYLIVSEEIGKYTAYSSIGSDENYDRYSWITTFVMNPQGTRETRDTTILMFQGSYALDDNFVWNNVVYQRQGAGIGAVFVSVRQVKETVGNETVVNIEFEQPTIALVKDGQRVDVPLQCLYFNNQMYKFNEEGYKGCFRIMPVLNNQGQLENPLGAGLFISEEGFKALWVNLYILGQDNPDFDTSAFKLVYGEDSTFAPLSIYNGRIIGPHMIWEINYPAGFTVDAETEAKYLGGNELLPDYFYDVN